MDSKEFLRQYRTAQARIRKAEGELEEIHTRLLPSAIRTDKEPSGGSAEYYGEELMAEAIAALLAEK